MKAVRFTIVIAVFFLMLMLSACLGTSVQESGGNDGDGQYADGDMDEACENTKDGEENQAGNSDFKAPLLTDPDVLNAVFGDSLKSININFGDYFEGWFEGDDIYIPYTFDALPGAAITAGLQSEDGSVSPAIILYGPRSSNGLWGQALTWAVSDSAGHNANIIDYKLLIEGQYLLLVSSYERKGMGRFFVSLGCHDQCREPACPDNTCQGFCKEGYLPDGNGCGSCVCRSSGGTACNVDSDCPEDTFCEEGTCIGFPAGLCISDADCPIGTYCDGGQCVYDSDGDTAESGCGCDTYYDPVCGADGYSYTNECLASCYGADVASWGPCRQDGTIPCSYDNDCPANMICSDYMCQSATDCGCPEYYDPVCGVDGLTYNNYCELACVGVGQAYWGVCDNGWNSGACQPICTLDSASSAEVWMDCNGSTSPVYGGGSCANCEALCLNIDTGEEGWYSSCDMSLIFLTDCLPPCGCNDSWEPVCGRDSMTYSNACQANCMGVEVAYGGECDSQISGCFSSVECPSGYICISDTACTDSECPGYCVPIPVDQECLSDAECPEGMYCKTDCNNPDNSEECSSYCVYDNIGSNPCIVTGCNFELCSDRMQQSYCQWQNEYACLDFAVCDVDERGLCGWIPAEGYTECMDTLASAAACDSDEACNPDAYCDVNARICIDAQCICPEYNDTVCGSAGQSYENPCLAVCGGAEANTINYCE